MKDFSTKNIIVKKNLKPQKHWGQVFLKNKRYLTKIITAASLRNNDLVLEIGAGTGILTKAILDRGAKVIALEKDPRFIHFLQKQFSSYKNLKIIQADVRHFLRERNSFFHQHNLQNNYKIVGNIPYYLTSYLLRLLIELKTKPKLIVLTIQKEVAQRITAKPPKMNLLAVLIQSSHKVKIVDFIPKTAFWPIPKIDSAIIKMIPVATPSPLLVNLVKAGFSHKRKYLLTNLSQKTNITSEKWHQIFQQLEISPKLRAQELSLDQWKKIHQKISSENISFML